MRCPRILCVRRLRRPRFKVENPPPPPPPPPICPVAANSGASPKEESGEAPEHMCCCCCCCCCCCRSCQSSNIYPQIGGGDTHPCWAIQWERDERGTHMRDRSSSKCALGSGKRDGDVFWGRWHLCAHRSPKTQKHESLMGVSAQE